MTPPEDPRPEQVEELRHQYRHGDHRERVEAAFRLAQFTHETYDVEPFPFRTDDGDVILELETGTLDGVRHVSKSVMVTHKPDEPCPECQHTFHDVRSYNNGVVGGFRDACNACDHVFAEDFG